MSGSDLEEAATERSFHDQLHSLIDLAHEHDINLARNWTCRSDDGRPDWEVEFVQLEARSD